MRRICGPARIGAMKPKQVTLLLVLLACSHERVRLGADANLLEDRASCEQMAARHRVRRVLHAGEPVTILGRDYGKDYVCVRVKTTDGDIGYVLGDVNNLL
jgi:hypothetical protein